MGLDLGSQTQAMMIGIIGMNQVVGPFLFLMSLLLMVCGGFRLIAPVCLMVDIITRYWGCRVWVFEAFWVTLFQLVVSPFNLIDKVMEDVGKKVGRMLNAEASHDPDSGGQCGSNRKR
jgi:hypothetical protein